MFHNGLFTLLLSLVLSAASTSLVLTSAKNVLLAARSIEILLYDARSLATSSGMPSVCNILAPTLALISGASSNVTIGIAP